MLAPLGNAEALVATIRPGLASGARVDGGPCAGARSVRYEEYHPYGSTAWWAEKSGIQVSRKRYRYTGMEKDEETGMGYHHHRYYMPWLGRWESADPAGLVDGGNRSGYARGSPVGGKDPTGLADQYIDTGEECVPVEEPRPGSAPTPLLAEAIKPSTSVPGNVAWRKDTTYAPEQLGFVSKDPTSAATPGEVALGRTGNYVPMSRTAGGAPGYDGPAYVVDLDQLPRSAVVDRAGLAQSVAAADVGSERKAMWEHAQENDIIDQTGRNVGQEREMMVRGKVSGDAVMRARFYTGARAFARGTALVGMGVTLHDVTVAGIESYRTGSPELLVDEVVRQGFSWGFAALGSKAGAAAGGSAAVVVAPKLPPTMALGAAEGALIGGVLGGMLGGAGGYLLGDRVVQSYRGQALQHD